MTDLTNPITQFQTIKAEYAQPDSTVDSGELYHCACKLEEALLATMQENDAVKLENELALNSCAELAGEVAKMWAALKAVDAAYCGVGDFEGTGENMAGVIVQVREALSNEVSDDK